MAKLGGGKGSNFSETTNAVDQKFVLTKGQVLPPLPTLQEAVVEQIIKQSKKFRGGDQYRPRITRMDRNQDRRPLT